MFDRYNYNNYVDFFHVPAICSNNLNRKKHYVFTVLSTNDVGTLFSIIWRDSILLCTMEY